MVEETRVMIIRRIQEELKHMESCSWEKEVEISKAIKNLSEAYNDLKDKE